jgi:membrane protein implicated in regulation of membrane protease activity
MFDPAGRRYGVKVKRNSSYGFWVFLAAIPLIVLGLYPAMLHYLGRHREHHELFHGYMQLPPYVQLLLLAVILPFAAFFLIRFVDRRRGRKAIETGVEARGMIVSVTPNGKKIKEGVNEYWGMTLDIEVSLPGKEPCVVSLDRYIYVMDIPRFQPGSVIRVMVVAAGEDEMDYLIQERCVKKS